MPTRTDPRDALKSAIRNHPNHQKAGSRSLSNMSVKELYALARSLGLDPGAIYRQVKAANAGGAPMPAADVAPEDADTVLVTGDGPGGDGADDDGGENETTGPDGETVIPSIDEAVESEVRRIRAAVTEHGFSKLDERLRDLITEARKPAVVIEVPVPGTGDGGAAAPVVFSRPTGQTVTWAKAFKVRGPLGSETFPLWDGAHPDTPKVDPLYVWPADATAVALTEIQDGQNPFLFGPKGTGKTEWGQQFAAVLGRPFALISCDNSTDGPTLVGMTVPSPNGGVTWQDGQLTRAIQIPGCVILVDEPSIARPGALFAMQNVLANRVLWIAETGRRVPVARDVVFIAADNTAGLGGGSRRGYTDTNRLNDAYLDRFGARVPFEYLDEKSEARVIVARVGCTRELALLLIKAATLTRSLAETEQLTAGLGLRRLMAWARLLHRGHNVDYAFRCAVLNASPEQDHETLRQQCALAIDADQVRMALNPGTAPVAADPTLTNPTVAGRNAANEFGNATPTI